LDSSVKIPTQCFHCHKAITDENETLALNMESPHLRLYCAECSMIGRAFYEKYHNHYQRTQILDHKHCLIMTNLHQLASRSPVVLQPTFRTELNHIYAEGLRATQENDYLERPLPNESNVSCDACQADIELVMFKCLCCRSFYMCEGCFTAKRKGDCAEHNS